VTTLRRAPRFLIVADGESVHTHRVATALAAAGSDVHLAAFSLPASLPGVTFHALHPFVGGSTRYLLAALHLRSVIRSLKPDVVHAHYVSSYGVMAAVACRRSLVQTAWGTDLLITAQGGVHRRLAAFALGRATLATGDSQSLLDEISKVASGTPTHRFVFGPPLERFGSHQKEDVVLSPRNHEANYQIELVLDAWRIASESLPGHRLIVAGSGSRTAALRRRASPNVTFTGMLQHDAMLDLVQRSRLVVSIPRSDATSAAVLEALAAGCSVVATDLEANREWVRESHLVPVDTDPVQLARTIVSCVRRPLSLDPEWSMENQIERLVARIFPGADEEPGGRDSAGF
jgi:glycosyltransferase involved in cell wall biosynthesis